MGVEEEQESLIDPPPQYQSPYPPPIGIHPPAPQIFIPPQYTSIEVRSNINSQPVQSGPWYSCYMNWTDVAGDNVGSIWNCTHCTPCCGEQCNLVECCYCCMCWYCCYPCNSAKLLASQNGQTCAIVNHCIPYFLASLLLYSAVMCSCIPYCLLETVVRHNARIKVGKGKSSHWFGDWFVMCCCCTRPCAIGQNLRTVPKKDWDCLDQLLYGDGCVCFIDNFDYVVTSHSMTPPSREGTSENARLLKNI